MTTTVDYSLQIPIIDEAETLVFGGGPAGIGAAVGAARNGADTMLIERFGFLGGNATASLVGPFMTSFSHDGKRQVVGGVFDELVRRMAVSGAAIHPSEVRAGSSYAGFRNFGHDHVTPFDPEIMKMESLSLVSDAGSRLRLHTSFVDVLPQDDGSWLAIVFGKGGMKAIRAQNLVDCTADADVAVSAGVATEVGRAEDGLTQPMTLFFRVANVDGESVKRYLDEHPEEGEKPFSTIVEQARKRGEFDIPRDKIGIYETTTPGVWRVNTTRIQRLSGLDPAELTIAEVEGRRQVAQLMQFFRAHMPGFKNAALLDTATQIGVRETRRIVGEYVLTEEDVLSGRSFPDTIAWNAYPMDVHSPTDSGGGATFAMDKADQLPDHHEIPFGSLLPRSVDGVMVAGRCISATHVALGAVRVMPPSFAMGQAAGTAAAQSLKSGERLRDIDRQKLRATLMSQGAILE